MENVQVVIHQYLEELRLKTSADFAAFACQEPGETVIRWKYAVGNRNERFRRIVLRPGKGIAGKVLLSGRLIILENYQARPHSDPKEYPIIYAEELQSAMGVPVILRRVKGVLLLGYRNASIIRENIIVVTEDIAKKVADTLQSRETY